MLRMCGHVYLFSSEAIQRAGRAGRTAAGQCHRLYTQEIYSDVMKERIVPEIQRTSLTAVALQLKAINIDDVIGYVKHAQFLHFVLVQPVLGSSYSCSYCNT